MSIVEQRTTKQNESRYTIKESENETSSMYVAPKTDRGAKPENLMGSHLINNLELYPQTDCMMF